MSNDSNVLGDPGPAAPHLASALLTTLGIRVVRVDRGRAEITCVADERHLRSLGMVHGGLFATMIDSCTGLAGHSVAPAGHYTLTVELHMNFVRAAKAGETLTAVGTVRHGGRRTAVVQGEITLPDGTLVATGSATLMHLPNP